MQVGTTISHIHIALNLPFQSAKLKQDSTAEYHIIYPIYKGAGDRNPGGGKSRFQVEQLKINCCIHKVALSGSRGVKKELNLYIFNSLEMLRYN